ncbi:hypothetical protein [Streptomyces sp. 7-21]|uniref:hypothetical protein n=1 Tax=Streptomyces sp. 7-21 TaxID=2802283 RepID=UPI00191D2A17|nr:hypothetical protein [Streptomyces sp. 7-21]MBL1067491.1 hypothetical protein [Streptomyces sp. 7-21]
MPGTAPGAAPVHPPASTASGPAEPAAGRPELPSRATPERPQTPPTVNDEAATELIPPVRDVESTTRIRPVSPSGPAPVDSEGATELIPPVTDAPAPGSPEDTTRLRPVRPRRRHAAAPPSAPSSTPSMPAAGGSGGTGDSGVAATQALPKIPADDEGEFDGLFRSAAQRQQRPGPGTPAPRRRMPVPLVAAVVVGCAVIGFAAGALFSGGGGSSDDGGEQSTTETTEQENGGADSDGSDAENGGAGDEEDEEEARRQAEALSSLLEDSNASRDAVISAVDSIRNCRRLDAAATDLRDAAAQRESLVERLAELELDALPEGEELAAALREAWEASAEADAHYADWADDVRDDRRRLCRGGQARHTGSANDGDTASGEATAAKERAAELWNPVAERYGLPERSASQL